MTSGRDKLSDFMWSSIANTSLPLVHLVYLTGINALWAIFLGTASLELNRDLASEARVDREFVRQSHAQMLASSMAADAVSRAPLINVVSVFYDK